MSVYFLEAYGMLIRFDFLVGQGDFSAIYKAVRNYPVRRVTPPADAIERMCSSVDLACIWYWKHALCLQRSAAATCLLKRHGVHAQMVIGAQQIPFKAHAWVEVDGRVVNDKPYTPQVYAVLDRC